MNYELALKLKDAGFPQDLGNDNIGRFMDRSGEYKKFGTRNPTLSELIEACGDEFKVLYLKETAWDSKKGEVVKIHQWQAGKEIYWDYEEVDSYHRGVGSTREEAVANLWLKLNNL